MGLDMKVADRREAIALARAIVRINPAWEFIEATALTKEKDGYDRRYEAQN
jgi:hypothetical protein